MTASARAEKGKGATSVLHLAFELGAREWKLGFTTGLGRPPRYRTIRAGRLDRLMEEIERARARFDLPPDLRVVSCYEAGRDGFWLHRFLRRQGVGNHVVDSSSIEVSRRARRRKTDRLDLKRLLRLLARYELGEKDVWSVVNAPSRLDEDRRQLHRELEQLIAERTERTNRIKGLLLTQGVQMKLDGEFPKRLEEARLWDDAPLPRELRARLHREWMRRDAVAEEIRALEAERRDRLEAVDGDSALEQVRRLVQLRGIGVKSAWLFVMEFFAWRDFNNGKEVGALAGLAPTPHQSGDMDHDRGVEKAGNARVRTMAVQIAWSWIRNQPDSRITRWFDRRFANAGTRGRRRGVVAVARKVLVALWRYLEYGELPEGAVLNG